MLNKKAPCNRVLYMECKLFIYNAIIVDMR